MLYLSIVKGLGGKPLIRILFRACLLLHASLFSLYILSCIFVSLYLSAFVRPALFVLKRFIQKNTPKRPPLRERKKKKAGILLLFFFENPREREGACARDVAPVPRDRRGDRVLFLRRVERLATRTRFFGRVNTRPVFVSREHVSARRVVAAS